MSGHSHWAGIKHKKGLADAKRSKVFSKLAQELIFASRGGSDPAANVRLRTIIEKAKSLNMPADNIERAIKKGSGELKGRVVEEMIMEAYGPGGIAIIIECITDNKNRTVGEVRQIISRHGGKCIEEGGVRWMFQRRGIFDVDTGPQQASRTKEEWELSAIEAGAVDILWTDENTLEVQTEPESLEEIRKNLERQGALVSPPSLGWVAKESVTISDRHRAEAEKLFEELDDNDAVQEIYSNAQ
ncbi:MAG: YebC/PmpR family DNA-binding transcriptional regulator [Candidatus Wildermuthbacteria bacterium]|nr:YebC/PmpR family DNA-binding transcriptional regulator [Candidatus Wildermuthbacteria bacterium]MBI2121093.1 YebC/PmpR family DNA-binding transcriptional regulator [Candidatus Wildermuthbacteria bacterium]